ncbi:MAG: tetratricopeptide repeat protein [Myxococcales bacterium FL481]|nr:MAG: tetratricopeptide repeat protein [Myxococcales bacterium FL481]
MRHSASQPTRLVVSPTWASTAIRPEVARWRSRREERRASRATPRTRPPTTMRARKNRRTGVQRKSTMKTYQALFSTLALCGLMSGCAGSGGGAAGKTAAPGSKLKPEDRGNRESPSDAAKKAFAKAVASYKSAGGGDTGVSKGDCASVAGKFTKVYEKFGDQMVIARFNAAATWEECGDTSKARDIYKELVKAKYWPAYNNLGVLYWNEGNTSKALEYFEKATQADRAHATDARNNLAVAHRDKYADKPTSSDFNQAQKQLRSVLVVETWNKKAYENLARLYYDRGRLEERSYLVLSDLVVQQALRVLREHNEESAELWNLRGLLYLARENNQVEAYRAFQKAVEIDPQHVDGNLNIAFISIRFRDYEQAEKSLAIALKDKAQKRNAEAHLAMGVAKRGVKKYKEAEKYYNKAIKLAADDPRGHFNLGILHQEHMVAADDVGPKEIEALYNTAKKHYNKSISVAGSDKDYADGVTDAKERVVVIDDAIETFRVMEELEKQAKALEKQAAEEAAKERKRLLELEEKALAAEAEEEAATEKAAKASKEASGSAAKEDKKKPTDKKSADKKSADKKTAAKKTAAKKTKKK